MASRDLSAGELLFADEPFAQTVHDRWQNDVCHVCYSLLVPPPKTSKRVPAQPLMLSGCAECGQVAYCGAACAALGAADHEAECAVLSQVRASGDSRLLSGVRGLRLFIRLLHRAATEPKAFAARQLVESEVSSLASSGRPLGSGLLHALRNRVMATQSVTRGCGATASLGRMRLCCANNSQASLLPR